jgi:chorismate mutase
VLIHWNTDKSQQEIKHVYLNEAIKLRPDLVNRTNS